MTLPDNAPARKARRLGLIIPWSLAGLFALAWTLGWFWLAHETERKMDEARASIQQAGWRFDWTSRKVSGFPFRLNIDLTDARWGEVGGLSVDAPVLKAQAYVSTTDHWTLVAPRGVVLTRARGGPIHVSAKALRASLSHMDQNPPTISVEALNLAFATPVGATPFKVTGARELHLHTKSGPDDQGAVYFELDDASGGPGTRPQTSVLDAIYSHAGALRGNDFAGAVLSWKRVGGAFQVLHADAPPGSPAADLLHVGDEPQTGRASAAAPPPPAP